MQYKTDPRVEEIVAGERAQSSRRWYRRAWAQPMFWLHPTLRELPKHERDLLLEESRLQARGSFVSLWIMIAWLILCAVVWLAMSAATRQVLGASCIAVSGLGAGLAHQINVYIAVRKNLATRQTFEASKKALQLPIDL
jgi:hypothetical protein